MTEDVKVTLGQMPRSSYRTEDAHHYSIDGVARLLASLRSIERRTRQPHGHGVEAAVFAHNEARRALAGTSGRKDADG